MALSPLDIQNKSFASKKFNGYDKNEVDDFLDQVMRDYEELTQKSRSLEKDLKHSNEKLDYYNQLKENMNETLITAKSMEKQIKSNAAAEADIVVREARQEADHIVTDAKAKANNILNDAVSKAKQLAKETDDLKAKTRVFHQRLSLMLEAQLKGMQTSEWEEILQPFSTTVGDDHEAFRNVIEGNITADDLDKGDNSEVEFDEGPVDVATMEEHLKAFLELEEGTKPAVAMDDEPSYIDSLVETSTTKDSVDVLPSESSSQE
jgi:cell division initiation protein